MRVLLFFVVLLFATVSYGQSVNPYVVGTLYSIGEKCGTTNTTQCSDLTPSAGFSIKQGVCAYLKGYSNSPSSYNISSDGSLIIENYYETNNDYDCTEITDKSKFANGECSEGCFSSGLSYLFDLSTSTSTTPAPSDSFLTIKSSSQNCGQDWEQTWEQISFAALNICTVDTTTRNSFILSCPNGGSQGLTVEYFSDPICGTTSTSTTIPLEQSDCNGYQLYFSIKESELNDLEISYEKQYVEKLVQNKDVSNEFSDIYMMAAKLVFEDQLTSLTEIILEKDLGSIKYQLSSELRRNSNFFKDSLNSEQKIKNKSSTKYEEEEEEVFEPPSLNRMSLFFSIGTNDFEIFKYIFEQGGYNLVEFRDPVTGITIFHLAMMLGNKEILEYIIESPKIKELKNFTFFDTMDSFRATGFDYAKLKGLLPTNTPPIPNSIQIYNFNNSSTFENFSIKELESKLNIIYTSNVLSTNDYLVDLLFSSLQINPDLNFRNKYLSLINNSGGEENVILGFISESVGWGLFAGKDFKSGDFIVRYGGMITMNDKMETTNYNMMISNEDFGLDASKYRSMGGMINHSNKFKNAESECIFEYGCEQALITATKSIKKGEQIFIDYSKSFWGENQNDSEQMIELGGKNDYPSLIKF
ncbi:hypothetical protein RB653_008473 [Dictyostelium firmibasis]|uniref:SET domain-containing protein n=1 Tax=Dictyostelium firmibasis TaxID=79012 RepID=A0AAN7U0D8_9MYCE